MKDIQDIYPASCLQRGMLIETEKDPLNTTYHDVFAYKIASKFISSKFEEVWNFLIKRHELLRAEFKLKNGNFYTFVYKNKKVKYNVLSPMTDSCTVQQYLVNSAPLGDFSKKIWQFSKISTADTDVLSLRRNVTFSERRSLYELTVIPFDDHFVLIFSFHHAIADGWSVANLIAEFVEYYVNDKKNFSDLPSYGNFIKTELEALQSEKIISFWKNYLEEDDTNMDFFSQRKPSAEKIEVSINLEQSKEITDFVRAHRISPDCFFLFAYKILMELFTNHTVKQIGLVVNNRLPIENSEAMFGLFLNTIPVNITKLNSAEDALKEKIKLERFKILPYEKIRSLGKGECFKCAFNYTEFYTLNDLQSYVIPIAGFEKTNIPFLLNIMNIDDNYSVKTVVDLSLVDEDYLRYMLDIYQEIVKCQLLGKEFRFVQKNSGKNISAEGEESIVDLFLNQVWKRKDAVAVSVGSKHLTYDGLNARANAIAARLSEKNIAVDDVVGICVDRSLEMVIGILGIWKAGAAYMPIDLEYPSERIRYMLENSRVKSVLTFRKYSEKVSSVDTIFLDNITEQRGNITSKISSENLVYVIYTSGSTGKPKGVMNTLKGVRNRLLWMQNEYQISSDDNFLQKTNYAFDVSVWEIVLPLISGAHLICLAPGAQLDPIEVDVTIKRNLVTFIHFVPSVFREYIKTCPDSLKSLKRVICSGEGLPSDLFFDNISNLYGPTEASIDVSSFNSGKIFGSLVPIGKPISNTQLHILGRRLEELPIGVIGEIYIGGVGVARGYANRPDLTAERFIANPFGECGRLYKTGDLGRYLPTGDIEYVGRVDNQVKIEGIRVELPEIEAAINHCKNVKASAVLLKDRHLIAYVVSSTDNEYIRSEIAKYLPRHMVPNYFISLEKLPVTSNGKLDTKSLLKMSETIDLSEKYVAPRNDAEKKICDIWRKILCVEKIGIDDDFFRLGGDSILAIQVFSKARKEGLTFSVRNIFEKPTIRELAEVVGIEKNENFEYIPQPFDLSPIDKDRLSKRIKNVVDAYPLSPLQEGLLFQNMYENSDSYFIQYVVYLDEVDIDSLRDAWQFIVDKYDVLRSGILVDEIIFYVLGKMTFEYIVTKEDLDVFLKNDRARGIDLQRAPLMRVSLVELPEKYAMVWSFHHIILDGWSSAIVLNELFDVYERIRSRSEIKIQDFSLPYRNYISWINRQDKDKAKSFWRNYLMGIENATSLSFKKIIEEQTGYLTAEYGLDAEKFENFCRNNSITMSTLLIGAIGVVLSRYLRQKEVVIGVTNSGRGIDLSGVENMVGLFINTFPVRMNTDFEKVVEWLKKLQKDIQELGEYGYIALSDLLQISGHGGSLFNVLFVYENYPVENTSMNGYGIEKTEYPLSIIAFAHRNKLYVRFSYQAEHFNSSMVDVFFESMSSILKSVLVSNKISELQMISYEEKSRLLGHNEPEIEIPPFSRLEKIFADKADSIAVSFGSRYLTYGKLDDFSSHVSDVLRNNGIIPDDIVGIYADRSIEQVIAIVGVIKSGAAYLPLDPDYPKDRINYMLQDSGAKMCLYVNDIPPTFGSWQQAATHIFFAPLGATGYYKLGYVLLCAGQSLENGTNALVERNLTDSRLLPPVVQVKESLAYIIYTSGSTGKPKGVLVTYQNIMNLFAAADRKFDFSPDDVWTMFHNFSFDVSVWEWLEALLHGARLVLVDKETAKDGVKLEKLISRNLVTVLTQTPRVLYNLSPCDLRYVITCGDKLDFEKIAGWKNTKTKIINMYGITETTVHTTYYEVKGVEKKVSNIGHPLPNYGLYILDDNLNLQPRGAIGEICVSGFGLARGYLNRPELTAEKFVANPFGDGDRLYRSGDLGRYLPDGNIEYIGRIDNQVKVRGYRIELPEIENAINNCNGVSSCAVLVKDQNLVAYVVADKITFTDVKSEISNFLPPYMVPNYFVSIDKLPLTSNGKLDKKSLLAVGYLKDLSEQYIAPKTEVEKRLCDLWQNVLGVPKIGIKDSFFQLGGNSISALKLVLKIESVLGKNISLKKLFEHPTIAGILQSVMNEKSVHIPPQERPSRIPLSFSQYRVWFEEKLLPGKNLYNIRYYLKLHGVIDCKALEKAFNFVIARHESCRTNFLEKDGEAYQIIHPEWDFCLEEKEATESEVAKIVQDDPEESFDLEKDHLLRVKYIKISDQERVLLITIHHIISDGWSMDILISELETAYDAFSSGRDINLPHLSITYADYAIWQRKQLKDVDPLVNYWKRHLEGRTDILQLPFDYKRPREMSYEGGLISTDLDVATISGFAKQHDVTVFMVMFSLITTLLYKYTKQENITIGMPVAGRHYREVQEIIGLFVNTLPIMTRFNEQMTFADVMNQVKKAIIEGDENQDIPFELLVEKLNVERRLNINPLFQVMIVGESTASNYKQNFALPGQRNAESGSAMLHPGFASSRKTFPTSGILCSSVSPLATQITSKFDLTFYVSEQHVLVEYSKELFREATIRRLLEHLGKLTNKLLKDASLEIGKVSIISPEEKRKIEQWNNTRVDFQEHENVIDLFKEQVEKRKDAIAVSIENKQLTYLKLDELSDNVARRLIDSGVSLDDIVGICAKRSCEMIIGILGILKAGAAYLPLDPECPEDRVNYMLKNSGAKMCVYGSDFFHLRGASRSDAAPKYSILSDSGICFVSLEESPSGAKSSRYSRTVGGGLGTASRWLAPGETTNNCNSNLSYVIYTSGSTGEPKGVMINHKGLLNRLLWMQREYNISENDNILQKTNYAFDVSVWELLLPLISGAKLVYLEPGAQFSPEEISKTIQEKQITIVHFVPSAWREYLRFGGETPEFVRHVIYSGEILSSDIFSDKTRNLYGPTEASIDVTCFNSGEVLGNTVPIGKPISNIQIYVLENTLESTPIGVVGEIYIGGVGLARGYVNRPDLTAERFVANPFGNGNRLYRTGDLGRYLYDGNIEYIGRIDNQVKIRGFRIELSEIESAITNCKNVDACVVLAKNQHLVAYIVSNENYDTIRAEISKYLPQYMIPNYFVSIEKIPLTSNGKLDKESLLTMDESSEISDRYAEPRNDIETALCEVWQEVLKIDKVGINDNFFHLGGDSILAIYVVTKSKKKGVNLQVKDIFIAQTIAELAKLAKKSSSFEEYIYSPAPFELCDKDILGSYVDINELKDAYPLSPMQKNLLFAILAAKNTEYLVQSVIKITTKINVDVLRQAWLFVMNSHDALRTGVIYDVDEPLQYILKEIRELPFFEYSEIEENAFVNDDRSIGIDLDFSPLIRISLIKYSDRKYTMVVTYSHIILDGWSAGYIINHVFQTYSDIIHGRTPLKISYRKFSDYIAFLQGIDTKKAVRFWEEYLRDVQPSLSFEPISNGNAYNQKTYTISKELSDKIFNYVDKIGVTVYVFLIGVVGKVFLNYTKNHSLTIGVTISGRNLNFDGITEMIGMFINTVPIVIREGKSDLNEYLQKLQEESLEIDENSQISLSEIKKISKIGDNLFNIMFVHKNFPIDESAFTDLDLKVESALGVERIDQPIGVVTFKHRGKLHIRFLYQTQYFTEQQIDKFFEEILNYVVEI